MKNILVLEDNEKAFNTLNKVLGENYRIFPDINTHGIDASKVFVRDCSAHVRFFRKDNAKKDSLVKYVRALFGYGAPSLFIVDLALRNMGGGSNMDEDGGVIRKEIFSEAYPGVPCLFLTGYVGHKVAPYMLAGDEYVFKFQDGEKNFEYVAKGKVRYFVKKLLKEL